MERRWVMTKVLALTVVMLFCFAASVDKTKVTKQFAGSTGDSLQAAPDTCTAVPLDKKLTGMWVVAASDSQAIYTVQISPDNTNWFTIDEDTVAAGTAEATADFGATYAGMSVRVIQDMIPVASVAQFGAAWVMEQK